MNTTQALFRSILSLVGHDVEVSTHSEPKPVRGKISNAMFDSFILEAADKQRIIRFEDVFYLSPLAKA